MHSPPELLLTLTPSIAPSQQHVSLPPSLLPSLLPSLGVSEKSGSALTKAMAAIVSSVPEAISIMPLEIAKVRQREQERDEVAQYVMKRSDVK